MCKWEIDFFHWSCCLCNWWRKMLHFILHIFFPSWNCLYMMRKEDDNWKITKRSKRCYMYVYASSAFVFCLRSALLPLFFFFRKTARIQAHHMCYRRAHPFFFFPVLCLTCSIITPILHVDVCVRRKKTNRERERTKDAKKLSIECV
jgi:hypothetical protein